MAGRREPQEWEPHRDALIERALAREVDDVDGGMVFDDASHKALTLMTVATSYVALFACETDEGRCQVGQSGRKLMQSDGTL
jgi:hypothetical protein